MHLIRYTSPRSFLGDVEAYLLEAEAENSLILGVAHALVGSAIDPERPPYFVAVHDAGAPTLAAFSNDPTRLGVTQSSSNSAISLLATDLVDSCPELRSIGGPDPTAGVVAREYARLTAQSCDRVMGMRIHELRSVTSDARSVTGALRVATEADMPILAPWVQSFQEETGTPGDTGALLQERLTDGRLLVWDDDGPVAMASWSGKTPNGARVNLVFTPTKQRGHGYASALVTELSRVLLAEGNQFCSLYTDLANPTSNAIYARIGYRPVCEAGLYGVGR